MGGLVDRSLLVSPDANKKKPKPAKPAGLEAEASQTTAAPKPQGLKTAAPAAAPPSSEATERVGALLAYGLLFLPFVFAWIVQKQNYSKRVRQLSLGWMTVMVVVIVLSVVARPQRVPPLANPEKPAAVAAAAKPAAPPANTTFTAVAANLDPDNAAAPSAPSSGGWTYSTKTDEMRGATSRFARLSSANTVPLAFPYGDTSVTLMLRDRQTDGFNLMLTADAQFVCSEYSQDFVSVKFDDGPIQKFPCSEPDASASGVIFIEHEKDFLAKLRNAKTLIVEAMFFNHGNAQMKFNVEGLKW